MKIFLPPMHVLIVWLEVNVFGETHLPEIFTAFTIGGYIALKMWGKLVWLSILKIKRIGVVTDIM